MAKKRTKQDFDAPQLHGDHPRPVTRRQFVAQGFMSGAAYTVGGGLLSLMAANPRIADAALSGDLAAQLGRSPSATSRLVEGLVQRGYVERAEEVVGGQLDIGEEHLVERVPAGHLDDLVDTLDCPTVVALRALGVVEHLGGLLEVALGRRKRDVDVVVVGGDLQDHELRVESRVGDDQRLGP